MRNGDTESRTHTGGTLVNISKLRTEDIGEFERRWPDAAAFLRHRGLVNERKMLLSEQSSHALCVSAQAGWPSSVQRMAWITARLKELEFLGEQQ
jgi:hypothetical protein